MPSEDSDQPAHSFSLIRIFTGHNLVSQGCNFFSCGRRRLIRLRSCAGISESVLGANVSWYISTCCGLYILGTIFKGTPPPPQTQVERSKTSMAMFIRKGDQYLVHAQRSLMHKYIYIHAFYTNARFQNSFEFSRSLRSP